MFKLYIDTPESVVEKIYRFSGTTIRDMKEERDSWMLLSNVTGAKITWIESNDAQGKESPREVILDVTGSFAEDIARHVLNPNEDESMSEPVRKPEIGSGWILSKGRPDAGVVIVVSNVYRVNHTMDVRHETSINHEWLVMIERADGVRFDNGLKQRTFNLEHFWDSVTPSRK